MSTSCGDPRTRRRHRRPPPQFRILRPGYRRRSRPRSHLLRPRLPCRRPQFLRLLPPRRRLPPQPRPRLPRRPRWLPHLYRLPLQVRRLQRRVATSGVPHPQSRQRTVMRRGWIAIRGLVAAQRPKTIARAVSRTRCQKGSAASPASRGRVSAASAAATGAVVDTDLPPHPAPSPPARAHGAGSPALICAGGRFDGRLYRRAARSLGWIEPATLVSWPFGSMPSTSP